MSENVFSLAAVILSGGKGERMRGQDKGLIEIEGKPMVATTVELATNFTQTVAISYNRNQAVYSKFGCDLLRDRVSNYQGPLAGIHSALLHYQNQFSHLLVLPCDTPMLSEELVSKLVEAARLNPTSICYLTTIDRPQFLHTVIPTQLNLSLSKWLEQGERAVYKWYRQQKTVEVIASGRELELQNFNTQADIK
ncbi:MAG: molybdenum cofactor guanylyltransferase MobA [Neptuniibacter sp.]